MLYNNTLLTRDALGRIVERQETVEGVVGLHGYEYDLSGRLSRTTRGGVQQAHYTYDDNGNRLSTVTAAGAVVGRYDTQDRLLRYCPEDVNGAAQPVAGLPCNEYQYRASGELLKRIDVASGGAEWDYDYDEHGALREVVLPDGRVVRYEIDAAGRRVGKRINGVKQWGLLYQTKLAPVAMLDASNNVVATFVYATRGNVPDYMVKGGQTYRFVVDHLGSVRMVVNVANGSVVQRMDYDEFGKVTLDTNPGWQPFGFAGGVYDADTGLVRFGARDYDAVTGRWTAKDPIGFGGGDTNLYAYVGGDPINFVDPDGLTRWDKMYGLPKKFWNWYHRKMKKDGDPDLDADEARDLCDQWEKQGRPGPDQKRKRGDSDSDFDWEDFEFLIPFPDLLDPCVIMPELCGGVPDKWRT